jgi:LemA protein
MKKSTIVILIVIVLVLLYGLIGYNRFVGLNESVDAQWKQVEVQYQRRFDLIPNLVSSVKGVTKQEQTVFQSISDARTKYMQAQNVDDKVRAASQVEGELVKVLAIFEAYPQLQSAEAFKGLMAELSGTENRVAVERRRFNEVVQSYNVSVKRFPSNMLARLFGFGDRPYFEAAPGTENVPKVEF